MTVLTNTTPSSTRSAALGGKRDVAVRSRRALGLIGSSLVVLALVVAGVASGQSEASAVPASAAASAAPQPSASDAASPTPTPTPTAPTIRVADSASSATTARGTATPGDTLRVLDPSHPASSLCHATASDEGAWSCRVAVASGAGQRLTVRDLTHASLPDVQSATFSILTAPVLSTSSGVTVGARVLGTGFPGATVTTTLADTADGSRVRVSAVVDGNGAWQAILPASGVPTGSYRASATQSSAKVPAVPVSEASAAVSITIDRDAPAAPRLVHPATGSTVSTQPLVFDGTGEEGDTVTVYVDSNPVCTTVVDAGRWSCRSTGLLIPAGIRSVQAAQRDPAGNYGAPSTGSRVTFASTTPTPTPQATTSPSASPQPQPTQPAPSPTSSSSAAPVAPGSGSAPGSGGSGSSGGGTGSGGSGAPGAGSPGAGGGTDGRSSVAAASSWTGPTGFGGNLPTLAEGFGGWSWLWALGLGLGFVLLILAPLRLAASALGGRVAVRARHFTGRNRSRGADDSPVVSPKAAVALTLASGAVLVALAFGVDDQLRYVRLVVAIAIGLGLVNGLGVILPAFVVSRRFGLRVHLSVSPRMLVAAALACLVTRALDLDPPMVLGVLLAAGLVDGAGRSLDEAGDVQRGGVLATTQLASLAVVSFVAWVAHGLMPSGSADFAVEITRETLATVCLAGLGSLIVLLVPLGSLPGRALYSWSRPTLVGLGVVGVALAAVVYAGDPAEAFPLTPLVVAAVAFAVLAVSTWVWVRYVEPAADDLT